MPINAPVNRNNLFYSEEDYELETELLSDYMEEDTNQTIVLYEVDRIKTNTNDIYHETPNKRNIRFKPPKELPCLYEIKEAQTKTFDDKTSSGVYMLSGNLTVYILENILKTYKCDIKRGDYIGVLNDTNDMYYFSVISDGKINNANNMVVGAYKSPWLVIECAPVTRDEFDGI